METNGNWKIIGRAQTSLYALSRAATCFERFKRTDQGGRFAKAGENKLRIPKPRLVFVKLFQITVNCWIYHRRNKNQALGQEILTEDLGASRIVWRKLVSRILTNERKRNEKRKILKINFDS